ncbi:hypothetical protein GCM10008959_25260 [Deinococcus seoulensis]|uniref:Peptidase S49 domain-containing protein n=1 Tax=Deinococcus seoulensis TaxID=1837379 RepID=A0ABQ2RVX3_9DEIO|nr:S49 family peptidase [Deinococcus seoulensis]GGR62252.1 hypothetical protein GCM10008959_25260 [Deinococcus seoulensis]
MTTKTRSPTHLSGVTALIANGRWAIKGDQLQDIVTGFSAYLAGHGPSEDTLRELRAAREGRAAATQDAQDATPSVAIIPLHGTIFPRGSMMVWMCGAVDPHTFADRVRAAAQDPAVTSIIIDIDSGGGAVSGIDVAAQAVAEAAQVKTVTAIANTMACSAAYWIGAQATEFIVTPAGEVGSIGVIGTHTDQTAALEGEGLKVTYVRSTERKALGQPGEAMDGPVLAQWQAEMATVHDLFVQAVATGRGVTTAKASTWATGDVWFGDGAVTAGLADRVGTLNDIITEHLQAATPQPAPTLRLGRSASAEDPHQEDTVLITVKDRTGKTHTLDTTTDAAQTDAQTLTATLESGAYEAGIQAQRELTAAALGVEVNDLTADRLTQLRAQAADGAAYRASLIEKVEALATGVYGADATAAIERAARLASKADTADLPGMIDDLTAQKAALYPAGRQSKPDNGAPAQAEDAKPTAPTLPPTAFNF